MRTFQKWEPREAFTHFCSTCHHNKHSLEISLCCTLKDYASKSPIYVFWVGGCFCTKLFPFLRMQRALQRDKQMQTWALLHICSWHTPGGKLGCPRCQRNGVTCATGVCAPSQHRGASPAALLPSQGESLCKSVKGSGDIPTSAEILHAERTKSPAILISIAKTKPLKTKPNNRTLHNNSLRQYYF